MLSDADILQIHAYLTLWATGASSDSMQVRREIYMGMWERWADEHHVRIENGKVVHLTQVCSDDTTEPWYIRILGGEVSVLQGGNGGLVNGPYATESEAAVAALYAYIDAKVYSQSVTDATLKVLWEQARGCN